MKCLRSGNLLEEKLKCMTRHLLLLGDGVTLRLHCSECWRPPIGRLV